jgi:tetratricopeptide (TPR) repeat protein
METAHTQVRLAAATIVRNDEGQVAETIASVRGVADEVFVLDLGSTDRSAEIATEAGAIVLHDRWRDDFANARNRLLNRLDAAWVLWLDPGERLASDSAHELRAFVAKCCRDKVYGIFVELPAEQPGASGEQAAQFRLMPNRPELWYEGRVRESVYPSLELVHLRAELAPGRIYGDPRRSERWFRVRRAKRNLELVALERARDPRSTVRLLLAEGDAAADLGDFARSRYAFTQAVRMAAGGSTELLEAYYGLMASHEGLGDRESQMQACLDGLEAFPLDAQLLCATGAALQLAGQLNLAARTFELAVKHGQIDLQAWHLREIAEVAAVCWVTTLQLAGRRDDARSALAEALARYPQSLRIRHLSATLAARPTATPDPVGTAILAGPHFAQPAGVFSFDTIRS